jgi:hypothetical protein
MINCVLINFHHEPELLDNERMTRGRNIKNEKAKNCQQ